MSALIETDNPLTELQRIMNGDTQSDTIRSNPIKHFTQIWQKVEIAPIKYLMLLLGHNEDKTNLLY